MVCLPGTGELLFFVNLSGGHSLYGHVATLYRPLLALHHRQAEPHILAIRALSVG